MRTLQGTSQNRQTLEDGTLKMLTSEFVKQKARDFGASIVGIGDINLFAGTPLQRDPRQILPNAKCIIGCGFRVPRALYGVMESKRQFFNYTQLGVKFIDEDLSEIFLLKMASMIEDEGYDACVQRNVSNLRIKGDKSTNPEVEDTYELVYSEAVAPGKPAPDVIIDFNQAAAICGMGNVGDSGHLLVPGLGPFVRTVFIVTDAPLVCDKPCTDSICDHCGKCAAACPGNAIGTGGLDTWQCAVYYRGAHKSNPFMSGEALTGNPERQAIIDGEARFDSAKARALYPELDFLPSRVTGYAPCICGKACDTACYKHLKEADLL